MKNLNKLILVSSGMWLSQSSCWAAEFEVCPTQAFIIQTPSSVPKTYSVELSTGSYTVASSDMGTTKAYNGVGFNYHDNYIYGWDYESATLGKTGMTTRSHH